MNKDDLNYKKKLLLHKYYFFIKKYNFIYLKYI